MKTATSRPITLERLDALLTQAPAGTFWRHDVDFSLTAAINMAQFEYARGISSTYYLFLDGKCPFYTAREAETAALVFHNLNHSVGWHVDERTMSPGLLRCLQLEGTGMPLSWHCPTRKWLWRDLVWCENAYASIWRGRYYADSGGSFRFGDPEEAFSAAESPIQVNLHAEHWFEPDWFDRVDFGTYESFFHARHPRDAR